MTSTRTASEETAYEAPPARAPRRRRRWGRWAFVGVPLALIVAVGALANRGPSGQAYDPSSALPNGTRALATLLQQRGVSVTRVATAADVVRTGRDRAVTVVVPEPDLVPDLRTLSALTGGRVVLFAPSGDALADVAPGLRRSFGRGATTRAPGCDWPAAVAAGRAFVGGATYTGESTAQCYPADGHPSLVVTSQGGKEVVVVGTATLLTNGALADEGNAALAVNLLAAHDAILWVLPHPGEVPAVGDTARRSLESYLPLRVTAAAWTVALGVLLLGLAYGRRLGRIVAEPLPVVVRAAETVEGKARLYRAARAMDRAAGWLRDAALHDLRTRAGIPPDSTPAVVIDAVAARTGRSREDVAATLYGPAPTTDRDLIALADALDRLTAEVRRQ